MKKLAYAVLTAAMAGGIAVGSTGIASAAHCVEDGEPGFSYFGTGVASEEKGPQNEQGDGTPGASSCRNGSASSTDPSDRAPGQADKS